MKWTELDYPTGKYLALDVSVFALRVEEKGPGEWQWAVYVGVETFDTGVVNTEMKARRACVRVMGDEMNKIADWFLDAADEEIRRYEEE